MKPKVKIISGNFDKNFEAQIQMELDMYGILLQSENIRVLYFQFKNIKSRLDNEDLRIDHKFTPCSFVREAHIESCEFWDRNLTSTRFFQAVCKLLNKGFNNLHNSSIWENTLSVELTREIS